jgi:hypothetical protein
MRKPNSRQRHCKNLLTNRQGVNIDKTHKVNSVTYNDYDRIISLENTYHKAPYKSFTDLVKWEEGNLTEMCSIRFKDRIVLYRLHYLKKEFLPLYTIPISKVPGLKWSPQGKYLVVNEGNCLKFYGGHNIIDVQEQLDFSIKEFTISNNEAYCVTFSGYIETDEQKNKEVK